MKVSQQQEQEILESVLLYYYNYNNIDISNLYLFNPSELLRIVPSITKVIEDDPFLLQKLYSKVDLDPELKNLITLRCEPQQKNKFFDEDLIDSQIKEYIKYDFILMYIDYCYKNWSYILQKILQHKKSVVTLLNIDCMSPNTSVLLLYKELTSSLFKNYILVKSNIHRI